VRKRKRKERKTRVRKQLDFNPGETTDEHGWNIPEIAHETHEPHENQRE
jgi:hypothetical protein